MASAQSYIDTGKANLNNPNATIQQLIQQFGGYNNPASDSYNPYAQIDAINPELMNLEDYLNKLGTQDYTYKYEDFLAALNNATNAGYDAQQSALDDAQRNYFKSMGANQETAADTIRSQYAQAIQQGISKGMQNANLITTLLGNSQTASDEATKLAQERYQAGQEQQAALVKNASDALTQSNTAYQTIMGNIRQLYNDQIQQRAADLQYNAAIADANANYAANKYTADTNYASGINNNAAGVYNNNQSSLSNISSAGIGAAAQDNYSSAYQAAAAAAAAATRYAAEQQAAATRYNADKSYAGQLAQAAAYKTNNSTTKSSGVPYASVPKSTTGSTGTKKNYTSLFNNTKRGGLTNGIKSYLK